MQHTLIISFSENATGLFLPNAYIVNVNQEGLPAYIRQKATESTIGAYQLVLTPERKRLFDLLNDCSPKFLEKKFNSAKKPKALDVLWEDKAIQPLIRNHVNRVMDQLIQLAGVEDIALGIQSEREVIVANSLLTREKENLDPKLFFRRTEEGIVYRFSFLLGTKEINIREGGVIPLTNHPAWLIVGKSLYKVPQINGNMVMPFRTKDELLIPPASAQSYLQKFILKVVANLDVEAEGFEVVEHDALQGSELVLFQDLFSNQWGLRISFRYERGSFFWKEKKEQHTQLDFRENGEVYIYRVRRNAAEEKAVMEKLWLLGLAPTESNYVSVEGGVHSLEEVVGWLSTHTAALQEAGIEIAPAMVEDKEVALFQGVLTLQSKKEGDWFDLHGEVVAGGYRFPFAALVPYIKARNPLYPLPDGRVFLIPNEWFEKYGELVQFGKVQGDGLRLVKSQYTLLEGLIEQDSDQPAEDWQAESFVPSQYLKAELRPYQTQGVKWLLYHYRRELGACLADDMGLGKTLQTISVLLHAKEARSSRTEVLADTGLQLDIFSTAPDEDFLQPLQALIVMPASLVYNWEKEIKKFAPQLTIYAHSGLKRHDDIRLIRRFDVVLTTYQTAMRDADLLEQLEWEYIVLDESQYIKNKESQIFRTIRQFRARHRLSLSGTPIENSLSDLWAQMQFINPGLLGNFAFFEDQFIRPIERGQDNDKKDQLKKIVGPYLLRRTKAEVAPDLPELSTQIIYMEMATEQQKIYEREKSAIRNQLLEQFDGKAPQFKFLVLQALTRLRQLVNHPGLVFPEYNSGSGKFDEVLEKWDTVRKAGHKMLFFSSFVQYLEYFKAHFEESGAGYAWLTGSLDAKARKHQIGLFENDPAMQTFLISLKAGGTGLNLVAADYVFMLDPWWNPASEQQAIARAHRIGQTKNVFALKFITRNSIEEKILLLQERKAGLAEDILAATTISDWSKKDLDFLLS